MTAAAVAAGALAMDRGTALAEVLAIYEGADGEATTALYRRLAALGPAGAVAVELFRAQKASSRAKVYRGGGYRGMAYDRKGWAIGNLCRVLTDHGDALAITWGWAEDPAQGYHRWVLTAELPTGQVSFHAGARGAGPDYGAGWDGVRGAGADRICRWCARLLEGRG